MTLSKLKQLITSKLDKNSYFDLDTGEQSFIMYPTNHIYLVNDFFSINIGHIVYENITVYNEMVDNIKELYNVTQQASEKLSDHVSIIYMREGDQRLRAVIGGLNDDHDQVSEDFETLEELSHFVKTFEFEINLGQEN